MLFTNLDQSNAISLCKCHQRIFHSIFSDPNCEKVEKFKCTKRRSPKKQSQWTTYWDWNGKMKMENAANEMRRYKWLKIVYYRCDWLKIANETNKKRLTNYIQISTNGLTTIQLTWKRTHEYSCDSSVVNLLGNCPALYQNEFQPKHKFLLVSFFSISFEVNFWKKSINNSHRDSTVANFTKWKWVHWAKQQRNQNKNENERKTIRQPFKTMHIYCTVDTYM